MIACPCGHRFDARETGLHGCPNCCGESTSSQVERDKIADRQARSRKARAAAGGKQIAVMLTPAAAAKLSALVAKGETISGVINRMLAKSRP